MQTPAADFERVATPSPFNLNDWENVPSVGTRVGDSPAPNMHTMDPAPLMGGVVADGSTAPLFTLPTEGPHLHPLLNATPPT